VEGRGLIGNDGSSGGSGSERQGSKHAGRIYTHRQKLHMTHQCEHQNAPCILAPAALSRAASAMARGLLSVVTSGLL